VKLRPSRPRRGVLVFAAAVVSACATRAPAPQPAAAPAAAAAARPASWETHELLDAVLWAQTAAEHDALCRQAFVLAAERVEQALRDPRWTALPSQTGDYGSLPPAVVFDADETIIDNTGFEAEMIKENKGFDGELLREWEMAGRATALPGALEFVRFLKEKGVEPIVITNRDAPRKPAVVKNLLDLGFPVRADGSTVLLRGERKEWPDKESRRVFVSRSFRVLLLLGDDLGDFLPGVDTTVDGRRELAESHRDYWGSRWILLPNAMYGSWERALYPRDVKGDRERLRAKYDKLRGFRK